MMTAPLSCVHATNEVRGATVTATHRERGNPGDCPNPCHAAAPAAFVREPSSMRDDSTCLLEALRGGSPEAFQQVYFAEKNWVFALLLRLSGDANVAADLFQNVWLKLARHAARLHEDTNLRAWLTTVARREYLSYRRA